ncbi:hypothetical protein ABGB12_00140 [Actinocorallia sp. B10E7]|uniref:hypothetical protein n=1 Tax=Actinocorallia sp. B10E7 TaxID=3153558 RepID=UPI00325F7E96
MLPAPLGGDLIAGSLQADEVRGADGAAARLEALGSVLQTWLTAAGLPAPTLGALFGLMTRRGDVIGEDRLFRAFN